jgi:hypothetical protein
MYRVADMIKIPCWGHQDPIFISFIYIVSINSVMTRAQHMGLVAGKCLSLPTPLPNTHLKVETSTSLSWEQMCMLQFLLY